MQRPVRIEQRLASDRDDIGVALRQNILGLLPAAPRDLTSWLPMLFAGTIAGALLALDNALDLDLTSFLYPGWQGSVAVGLAMALRRAN